MGLFPIFMNIIQFWVIDSIIKVGGVGGLGPPPEEPDESDNEPLFNSIDGPDSDDDDEEEEGDSGEAAKRDVEAQTHTHTRLRRSADSSHTYPPSLPGSPTSTSATIRFASVSPPPTLSRSLPLIQRRRSSPPPLLPRLTVMPQSLPSRASEGAGGRMKEDWQAWGGEEDWADREGEEDLIGRQAEEGS